MGMGIAVVIVFASARREVRLEHVLLVSGLAAGSAYTNKFCIYLLLASAFVITVYANRVRFFALPIVRAAAGITAFVLVIGVASAAPERLKALSNPAAHGAPPDSAIAFMERSGAPQPVFNPFEWGGYLSWRLYPEYKFFTDARIIDYGVYEEYEAAAQGMAGGVLDKYKIATVVFYPVKPLTRSVQGIVLYLVKSPGWALVYMDDSAVVFVRANLTEDAARLPKDALVRMLIGVGEAQLREKPESPEGYHTLALVHFALGDWDVAQRYLDAAAPYESERDRKLLWPEEAPGLRRR